MQDGWSSIKNDSIIVTSIHIGEHSILINEKKNDLYCSEIAKENIEYIKETYNKDIFAICIDNETKMVNMKDILKETYPNLLTYGCSSHLMNLLEKEVTPKIATKHIIEIHKYFRNKHLPHGWLKKRSNALATQ
ncbi:unnamed protein product [Psylliodes chrysocephalus]|uniref:DUF659 domain-containing protein n=1 Tax=Psylliodes chrysocephalus TaxID=3402493 RepID=A0A9P0D0K4_9CUCU|nr:unnamed protein product [Psylliodes chrysocephala]